MEKEFTLLKKCTIHAAMLLALAALAYAADTVKPPFDIPPSSRSVSYHDGEILPISVALRYETVIRLPDNEIVLQPTGGDKDHWTVAWAANFVFIKAGIPGSHTNFNVLCKSGHLYSFAASEVTPGGRPDLLVIVSLVEAAGAVQHPKFVLAAEFDSCQARSKELEARVSEMTVGGPKSKLPAATLLTPDNAATGRSFSKDYKYKPDEAKELKITEIKHDDHFTYIVGDLPELMAVYAYVDGKHDHLLQAEYDPDQHWYRVNSVINKGYLKIGKREFKFTRKG